MFRNLLKTRKHRPQNLSAHSIPLFGNECLSPLSSPIIGVKTGLQRRIADLFYDKTGLQWHIVDLF